MSENRKFYHDLINWNIYSANRGDSLDRNIDEENHVTKDFMILVSR